MKILDLSLVTLSHFIAFPSPEDCSIMEPKSSANIELMDPRSNAQCSYYYNIIGRGIYIVTIHYGWIMRKEGDSFPK
jgi:hypothetical protein